MAFARAPALRTLQTSLRHSGQRVAPRVSSVSARTQQLVARRYASGGGGAHEAHAASSDIPWIIGAVAVTIPSCWYLLPDSSHSGGHGHDDHGEEHSEEGEKEEAGEEQEEAAQEEKEEKGEEEAEKDNLPKDDYVEKGSGKEDDSAADDKKFEKKEQEEQGKEPTKAAGDAQGSLPPGGDDNQKPESKEVKKEATNEANKGGGESQDEGEEKSEKSEGGEKKDGKKDS